MRSTRTTTPPRAGKASSSHSGSGRSKRAAQLVELGLDERFLLEQLLRPGLERALLARQDGERLLVGRFHDLAHRDIDLTRGFLAVFAMPLRQRPAQERRALLFVRDVAEALHHAVAH